MDCPACEKRLLCVETRQREGYVQRVRRCENCGKRYITQEKVLCKVKS